MLTISQDQLDQCENSILEKQLLAIQADAQAWFTDYVVVSTEYKGESFEDWYSEKQILCNHLAIFKPANVRSFVNYSAVYYPHFFDGKGFENFAAILQSSDMDETEKLNRVNYRLSFLR